MNLFQITTQFGVYDRRAWTGGDIPPKDYENPEYTVLVDFFYEEQVSECGGLDLWECAGTSVADRIKIFKNRARLDAWRTLTHHYDKNGKRYAKVYGFS